jgi:hypothetical protein
MNTATMSLEQRIKDERTVQEWNTHGRKQKCIQGFGGENLKDEGTVEDLGIAGSMILNRRSSSILTY